VHSTETRKGRYPVGSRKSTAMENGNVKSSMKMGMFGMNKDLRLALSDLRFQMMVSPS
jgi:hypothetical protein